MTKEMFPSGKDLPLFSGTPQAGKDSPFTPKDEPQQQTLYTCPICFDTGFVPPSDADAAPRFVPCLFCEAGRC